MSEPIIEATSVSLAYRLMRYHIASVHELAVRMLKRQVNYDQLWALRDVTFTLQRGETLALVGPNGAGKTTLLKLVGRVLPPTEGRIIVRGRSASLLELGAGFQPDLTGYENLLLYGTILGHDPRDLRRRASELAEWAGLEEFLDVPLRSFSTGMRARLGFAVAAHGSPDLLVIDEALSVGDEAFRRKSRARIEHLVEHGTSLIVVSHETRVLREVTQRAMWLDHGRVVDIGETEAVLKEYDDSIDAQDETVAPITYTSPATAEAEVAANPAVDDPMTSDSETA